MESMKKVISGMLIMLLSMTIVVECQTKYEIYVKHRKALIKFEKKTMLGARLKLTADEKKFNKILMTYKNTLLDKNTSTIDFSKHYLQNREEIQESELYTILKKMPKGGVLHIHDAAIHKISYLIGMTYKFADLYICFNKADIIFQHAKKPPPPLICNWTLVRDVRKKDPNDFDSMLESHLSMYDSKSEVIYPTRAEAVAKLMRVHDTIISLISNNIAYEQFMEDGLQTLYDDGAMYAEIRITLHKITDIKGNDYNYVDLLKTLKGVIRRFKKQNPNFVGVKLIYAPKAPTIKSRVKTQINQATNLKLMWPVNVAGFDQIWHDAPKAVSLDEVADLILDFKMPFYFHAGESSWNGDYADESLFSALAMKSRRLSPAFGLSKHQVLVNRVKKEHIGVVSTVISDQIFCLIRDIRNHPLAYYLADNLPVALSGDYPGLWGASPITDDFLIAFVAIASEEASIKLLKQLVINSIKYSAMDREKKIKTLVKLKTIWYEYVDTVVHNRQSLFNKKPTSLK